MLGLTTLVEHACPEPGCGRGVSASIYDLMVSGGSVLRCDPRPWEALHPSVTWPAADAAGLEDLVYRPGSVIMTYPAERGWTPT